MKFRISYAVANPFYQTAYKARLISCWGAFHEISTYARILEKPSKKSGLKMGTFVDPLIVEVKRVIVELSLPSVDYSCRKSLQG